MPGRTTAPTRAQLAGTFPRPRSATCTTAIPRNAGWTSGSRTRSSRCSTSGSACARKGFDAVELDDIDSFDPASTGFDLTPGDAGNFLAYAFNEIHRYGRTGLWKNSPYLPSWGCEYADGAIVEECYLDHACFASQLKGSSQYGITCTALTGAAPCGWDDFTTDVTRDQPTGKWVGEAGYSGGDYVCDPGQKCPVPREFGTFCRSVCSPPYGFAAVKFDDDLDGEVFHPCP